MVHGPRRTAGAADVAAPATVTAEAEAARRALEDAKAAEAEAGAAQAGAEPAAGEPGAAEAEAEALAAETAQPGDVRERAHRLCREYLHGAWRTVAAEELVIRKVSGGLSNLLFYCSLPAGLSPSAGEPARVLLRLYGQLHGERALDGLITESVIFTLLSESQRGPRLLGVFPGGRIEEYIPARPLLTKELQEPQLSTRIAEKMAQIHLMNVPINKEPRWLWDTMERWMATILEFMAQKDIPVQFQTMTAKLIEYNLQAELRWLKKFLTDAGSPVVFCHNDIQEGNILLKNGDGIFPEYERQSSSTEPSREAEESSQQLVIIDFEYCAYNYRGFDFANHMCEWTYDYSNAEHPYFWARPEDYPTKEQQELFFTSYLRTIQKEQEGSNENSVDVSREMKNMLQETKYFTLASHFFWGLWSVVNATVSKITFDYWAYGENRFEAYFKHKSDILSDQNTSTGDMP